MRSVVVVLPASMCAMMPMFLQRSNGTVLGTTNSFLGSVICFCHLETRRLRLRIYAFLPAVMRKRLVRFRHAMHIFLLLDGGAAAVGGIQQFIAQLVNHALFATGAGIADDPANRQRRSAIGINLNRNLIVRATNTSGDRK